MNEWCWLCLFHGLLTSLGFCFSSGEHVVSPSPRVDGKLKADDQLSNPVTVLLTSTGRRQVALAAPSRAPCRIRAGPRLMVGLEQGAGLGRGRGGASRCSKAGRPVRPGCPVAFGPASQGWTCTDIGRRGREAVTIGPRLRLLGGRCRDAGAGGGAELEVLTGPAGPGTGPGERKGLRCLPARPWIRCARGPGGDRGRRSAGRPQVRGRSLEPGGAAGF